MNLSNECLITIVSGLSEAINSITYNKVNSRDNAVELDCIKKAHSIILEEMNSREIREKAIKPNWKEIKEVL